jgi:hypothetical protein
MKRAKHYPLAKEKILEAANLHQPELRLLVASYYAAQDMRKMMGMQMRHLGDKRGVDDSPQILAYASESFVDIESEIAKALGKLTTSVPAIWLKAQRGIGPVITAGLIAHIDITRTPTAGNLWSLCGLNPEQKWEKGQKRPYSAALKQLTWHTGQCFMKQSNDPDCFYGRLYRERKLFEIRRNESGANAEKAKAFVVSPGATAAVKNKLKEGKLPDFNIDARARRYAVKIFLSHLHAVMFFDHFGTREPLPYSIAMLNHAHFIDIPHSDLVPGFTETMRRRA